MLQLLLCIEQGLDLITEITVIAKTGFRAFKIAAGYMFWSPVLFELSWDLFELIVQVQRVL